MKLSSKSKLKVQGGIVQSPHVTGIKTSMLFEHGRTKVLEEESKKGVSLREQNSMSTSTVSVIFCSSRRGEKRG